MSVASGEGHRLGAGDDLFHDLGGPDDAHAFCQLVFGDASRFGTGATEPDLALVGDELSHQIAELGQRVTSTEAHDDGRLTITVERQK